MGNEEINKSEPEKYMQRNFVAGGNVERHNPLAPASSVVQLSTGGTRGHNRVVGRARTSTNEEICGGLSRNYPNRSGSARQYHKQKVQQEEQAILAYSNAKMLNLGLQANPPRPPKGHRAKEQQPRVRFKADIALSQNGYGLHTD
jgi:hypothetical protein